MRFARIALTASAIGLAGVALASEEIKTKIAIAVVDDNADGEVRIELDSDELGFNLHDMQEGENRSIVDKSGKTILITREADGFVFGVDGKTIKMPTFDRNHQSGVWFDDGHADDVDFHVMHRAPFMAAGSMDGIMIRSGKPIDEATQQAIKSLLESAGHGNEVHFVNHEGPHRGPHRVKFVQKQVTQD